MHVIGLTGGIASGKSTVSRILCDLGACIIDADQIARLIVEPGEPAWQEILAHFGQQVFLPDRQIDRKALGDIVFRCPTERRILDEITHRRVQERIIAALEQAKRTGCAVVVLDVPLLLETHLDRLADEVWVVYVPLPVQTARLIDRNQLTADEAASRIASQMPLEDKRRFAAVIINNEGSVEATRQQVLASWQRLCSNDK